MFGWHPARSPMFGTGAVETAFGLAPAVSAYPLGPFVRTRTRNLTISLDLLPQRPLFPGDGLTKYELPSVRSSPDMVSASKPG